MVLGVIRVCRKAVLERRSRAVVMVQPFTHSHLCEMIKYGITFTKSTRSNVKERERGRTQWVGRRHKHISARFDNDINILEAPVSEVMGS